VLRVRWSSLYIIIIKHYSRIVNFRDGPKIFFVFRLHQKKDLQQCWSMHVSNPFSSPPTASSSGQQHPCGSNNQKKAVGCEAGRVAIESIILRPNAQQCPSGLSVRHTVINSYTVPVSGSTRDPTNQCMHASLDTTRRVLATSASSVSQSANQQPAITIHTSSVGFSSIFHDIQTTDIPSPVPSSASAVCILAHRAAVLSIRPSRPAHHSLSIPVNAIINIYPVMVTEEPTFFLSSASDSQPPIYIYIHTPHKYLFSQDKWTSAIDTQPDHYWRGFDLFSRVVRRESVWKFQL
jgi:hypothetical protein